MSPALGAALAVAVVATLVALVLWQALRVTRHRLAAEAGRRHDLARHLDSARSELARSGERLSEANDRLAASESRSNRGTGTARAQASTPAAPLDVLWALARLKGGWTRRDAAVGSTADIPACPPAGLADALDDEVSRIREETGTPGTVRAVLDTEPSAADSVVVLRAVEALLVAFSRHCEAYDLYVHEWEDRLSAVLVCDGFDGPKSVFSDAQELLAAIKPAGGELDIDRDGRGRVRARMSFATLSS